MFIHTHGKKGDPVILLLHPMGITGEKMYEVVGSRFEGKYYCITPDMGGHGSEKRPYRSAETEAAALHHYLQQKGLTQIRLLYGASLGCAVSLHLLTYEDLQIEHIYLDGAPVARLNLMMRKIFAPVLVWQQDMILKDREKGISDFVKRYGRDIAEHMADSFLRFDRASIDHIGRDCVVGNIPDLPREIQKRIIFDWGEKELYTKTSMPLVQKIWPEAEVIVRPGMEHCEAMAQEADYVRNIEGRMNGARPSMIRLQGLTEEEVREISRQIAEAFYEYTYNAADVGLIKFIGTREDMYTYIHGIVEAACRSGVLYATSDRREGYLMLSGEGAGGTIGFADGMKMIAAEKKALGGFRKMKAFIDACFADSGSIETSMRKEKRKFLRIEMLVVRKAFQGQGYMRQMMDYAYALADERGIPVILDTDDQDKAVRYVHLGMKLDRIRSCGEGLHMYDLIREPVIREHEARS